MPPSARSSSARPDTGTQPVARVLVDVAPPHLDRPFDYRVPADLADVAQPGVRVRVRFSGRLVNGYLLARVEQSEHGGTLARLERVVSPEPVLTPPVAALCRAAADHYAGTMADVVRLAVPPRHARTEAEPTPAVPPPSSRPEPGGWADYPTGSSLLDALAGGGRPHAVVSVLAGSDWADLLARAALVTAHGGRGVVLVLPDGRDVAWVDRALTRLGSARHVVLTGELRPSQRYRAFLAALRGHADIVVGTRSAVFAPVHHLGLLVVWDDGDDLLAEPRAPYPHARDVAVLRAHTESAGVLLAGFARTAEAARLVSSGWAVPVEAPRPVVRATAPTVHVAGESGPDMGARLPRRAFQVARAALERGPVLVQVPRRGYWPAMACQRCRAVARCPACTGPLGQDAEAVACRWCGRAAAPWTCPDCGHGRLRAIAVGSERTAEELGRAFPGVPVRQSGWGHVIGSVPDRPALVVATPGAEPATDEGYAGALLLDAWALLGRADLRAGEEAVRRWLNATALVQSGGDVVLVGPSSHPAVQALVRWDPGAFAERELADRVAAGLPPAVRLAEIVGEAGDVDDLLAATDLPASAVVLGPVPHDEHGVRALVWVPLADGHALTAGLHAAVAGRSARRLPVVRVRVDPVAIG